MTRYGYTTTAAPPPFSRGRISRILCTVCLVVCWLLCSTGLIAGIVLYRRRGAVALPVHGNGREGLLLCLVTLVALFNEVLGYIHGVALRWALEREGRLEFNTNLRLLTAVKFSTSLPNTWIANLVMLLALVVSYSATPLVFLRDDGEDGESRDAVVLSGLALIACTTALLTQAAIATACLFSSVAAPTWSSDPVDTAAACVALGQRRAPGRCLRSVHERGEAAIPVRPRPRQGKAYRAHPQVRWVLRVMWVMVLETLLWTVLIVIFARYAYNGTSNWSPLPTSDNTAVEIGWEMEGNTNRITDATMLRALGILTALQTLLTFATHCAELQVNCSRDESVWRRTATAKGLKRNTNIVVRALTSWQTVCLLVAKPGLHWLYGLAVSTSVNFGIRISPVQVVYLMVAVVAFAVFATIIANHKPNGPQPCNYGHVQTLLDQVDQWPSLESKMFWGHAGIERGIAHAGTSGRRLGKINIAAEYMGEPVFRMSNSAIPKG